MRKDPDEKKRTADSDSAARAKTTGNHSNGIHKTCQLPSLRLRIRIGGTTGGEPYAVHKVFLWWPPPALVPALYLPDNLTPIYGFVQVKFPTNRVNTVTEQ